MENDLGANIKQRKFILIFRMIYLVTVLMQVFVCVLSDRKYPDSVALIILLIYFSSPFFLLLFNINYKKHIYKYNNIVGVGILVLLAIAVVYFVDKTALGVAGLYYVFFVVFVLVLTGKYTLTEKLN